MPNNSILFFIISLAAIGFHSFGQSIKAYATYYSVNNNISIDSSIYKMLVAYKDNLGHSMEKVIGFTTTGLYKKNFESTIGDFLADCIRTMPEKKFGIHIDVTFVDPGSIKSFLPKGEITLRKIYDLLPYDNEIVLTKIKGYDLKMFLQKIAKAGGWPVSGLSMGLKGTEAINIQIGGHLINDTVFYCVANTDFITNGVESFDRLKEVPCSPIGYTFRDAVIDRIKQLTDLGQPIDVYIDNRIYDAN